MKPEKNTRPRKCPRFIRTLIAITASAALTAPSAVCRGGENAPSPVVSGSTTTDPGIPAQQDVLALLITGTGNLLADSGTDAEAPPAVFVPAPQPAIAGPARPAAPTGRAAAAKPFAYTVTTFATSPADTAQAAIPPPDTARSPLAADAVPSRPDAHVVTVVGQNGGEGSANGTGADARFDGARNFAADKSGNIYCKSYNYAYSLLLASEASFEIRKITPAGVASTIENTFGYDAPWALDAEGNIYVTKEGKIYKIDASGEPAFYADIILASGSGEDNPMSIKDMACDENGNLFVLIGARYVWPYSSELWKVDAGKSVTLLRAGGDDEGFYFKSPNDDTGTSYMAAAGGSLYILGGVTENARWKPDGIYAIDANTGAVTPFVPLPQLPGDGKYTALSADPGGNIYSYAMMDLDADSQTGTHVITVHAPSGDVQRTMTVINNDPEDWWYQYLFINNSDGNLFVSNGAEIHRLDDSGELLPFAGKKAHAGYQDGTGGEALLLRAEDIAIDSYGNAYVSESDYMFGDAGEGFVTRVRKIDPDLNVTTFATATAVISDFLPALAISASDSIISVSGTQIINISPEGQISYINGSYKMPVGLTVDNTGQLYSLGDNRVNEDDKPPTRPTEIVLQSIAPTGEATTKASIPIPSPSDFGSFVIYNKLGLAADSLGNLYLANPYEHTIVKVSAAGDMSTLAGTSGSLGYADGTGTAALFNAPGAIAVDKRDYLYVSDVNNALIRRVNTATGEVTTIIGKHAEMGAIDGDTGTGRVNSTSGIAVDTKGDGLIYICDGLENVVRILQVAPEILEHPAGATVQAGAGVTLTVDAMGAPDPEYQWYKDAVALDGQTGTALTISNAQASDAGNYTVVASNILAGNVFTATSNVATLTVGGGGEDPGGGSRKSGGGAPSLWFLLALGLAAIARRCASAGGKS